MQPGDKAYHYMVEAEKDEAAEVKFKEEKQSRSRATSHKGKKLFTKHELTAAEER